MSLNSYSHSLGPYFKNSFNIMSSHPSLSTFLDDFPGSVIGTSKLFVQEPCEFDKGVGMVLIHLLNDEQENSQGCTTQAKARIYNWNMLSGMVLRANHSSPNDIGSLSFIDDGTTFEDRIEWVFGKSIQKQRLVELKNKAEKSFFQYWNAKSQDEINEILGSAIKKEFAGYLLVQRGTDLNWQYDTSHSIHPSSKVFARMALLDASAQNVQNDWKAFEKATKDSINSKDSFMAESDTTALVAGLVSLYMRPGVTTAVNRSQFDLPTLRGIREVVQWGVAKSKHPLSRDGVCVRNAIATVLKGYSLIGFHDSGDDLKDEDDEFCQQTVLRLGGSYAICCVPYVKSKTGTKQFHRENDGLTASFLDSLRTPEELLLEEEAGPEKKIVLIAMLMGSDLVEQLMRVRFSKSDVVIVQG
jgi:hypothetical protein